MTPSAQRRNGPAGGRGHSIALVAAVACLAALLGGGSGLRVLPSADALGTASGGGRTTEPAWEVWQTPEKAHTANPTNPLAQRLWGVYQGPQDQVWKPYQRAQGLDRRAIGRIALRPRTKWYGSFVADAEITETVRRYIEASQQGNPDTLVQLAVFRMSPWEHDACRRTATPKEKASYRRWISNLAKGIGATPTLIVMQPDGPFLWCTPDPAATAAQLAWATRTLSALPATAVYIDAGAADWCENDRGADPERCAAILKRTGIRYARGFALDSTHYTGPVQNIDHGVQIVNILRRDGYGTKHFIVDTAKSGVPTAWQDMIPSRRGGLRDNARPCRNRTMRRCVTLGIPPTAQPGSARWGLPTATAAAARRHVDGFVWFGRPWLYNQADPFVKSRAVHMHRSTPWPLPRPGSPRRVR